MATIQWCYSTKKSQTQLGATRKSDRTSGSLMCTRMPVNVLPAVAKTASGILCSITGRLHKLSFIVGHALSSCNSSYCDLYLIENDRRNMGLTMANATSLVNATSLAYGSHNYHALSQVWSYNNHNNYPLCVWTNDEFYFRGMHTSRVAKGTFQSGGGTSIIRFLFIQPYNNCCNIE